MFDVNESIQIKQTNQGSFESIECPTHSSAEAELLSFWRYVLEGVLQFFLSSVGLLANSLSIFILTSKSLSNKTFNQLLTALALFDTVFLLIMFYESAGLCFNIESTRDWRYLRGILTPYLLYPGKAIAMTGGVYMMVSVAVERYIAVRKPFSRIPDTLQQFATGQQRNKIRHRILVHLLPVFLFSVIINIPKFLESRFIDDESAQFLQINPIRSNPTYVAISSWVRFLLLGIIPLIVVSVLNYKIYREVQLSSSSINNDDTLSIVLTFVVVVFVLCSLPRLIIQMYEVIIISSMSECVKESRALPFWNHFLGFVSHDLLVLNPFLNFLVYCAVGRTFRRVTVEHLCRVLPCLSKYFPSVDKQKKTWSFIGSHGGQRSFNSTNTETISLKDLGSKKSYNKVGRNLETMPEEENITVEIENIKSNSSNSL